VTKMPNEALSQECHMPDLSELEPLKKQVIINLLGFGDEGLSQEAGLYRRNFIRLIDKAITEYQEAREDLLDEIEEEQKHASGSTQGDRILYGFRFIDCLEDCINATRRLLGIVDKLKSDPSAAIIPRQTRRLLNIIGKDVTMMRNVIEHIDQKIQNNELKTNVSVMLKLSRSREQVSIGGHHLQLSQLALTLRKLHRIGLSLLELSP